MPPRFGQIIAKTSKGRINVDDPRWLREVLKMEPRTGTPIHARLYTEVWEDWAHGLGRDPSSEEIIQFAKRLEEQYSLEGTLFYRAGAGLPGRVDWEALLKLLGG